LEIELTAKPDEHYTMLAHNLRGQLPPPVIMPPLIILQQHVTILLFFPKISEGCGPDTLSQRLTSVSKTFTLK